MDNKNQAANNGQLIAEARKDPAAFAQLYRRHYDIVFRYCVHRLFDRTTAEDVTSVVFLSVVENFGRFEGSEQQFRNWLYKIATNAVNNHLRNVVRRNTLLKKVFRQIDISAPNCQRLTDEQTEKLAILKQVIFELKPRYQAIIALRFFENLKLMEIAEVLDCNHSTVRSQLARALTKLRKKIAAVEATSSSSTGEIKR